MITAIFILQVIMFLISCKWKNLQEGFLLIFTLLVVPELVFISQKFFWIPMLLWVFGVISLTKLAVKEIKK